MASGWGLPYRNSFWIWVGSLSFEGPSKRSSRRFRTSRWSPFFRRIIFLSGRNIACLRDSIVLRHWSVRNALKKVPDGAIVAIHDGVRPLLSAELIRNMFARMDSGGVRALIPVIPSVDTLKVIDRVKDQDGNEVMVSPEGEVVDRSRIFGAQTPQMFLSEDIKSAYSQAFDTAFTDDASVARKNGIPLSFCDGERYNFKLTSPEDLSLARLIISSSSRTRQAGR